MLLKPLTNLCEYLLNLIVVGVYLPISFVIYDGLCVCGKITCSLVCIVMRYMQLSEPYSKRVSVGFCA